MRYISVFSGIEAASVAWQPLGWEAVAFSEIEPFPCAVLAHHYPDVPNLGDISKVDWRQFHGTVDLVVGGSPCQSFSVAGKREGLDGASGLVREYFRLLQEVRPRWFVWENVPGALSSGQGNDFKFILQKWDEFGYHVAWRILDAQYYGVAQRRRRVFAIGNLADWRNPAKVLFEPESLSRHPAPSGKKGQKDPGSPADRAFTPSSFGGYAEGVGTLRAEGGDLGGGSETLVTGAVSAKWAKGTGGPAGDECYNLVLDDQGGPPQPHVLSETGHGFWNDMGNVTGTLRARSERPTHPSFAVFQPQQCVRRLTPLECERLQGFPDDWTDIEFRGKPAPDGARYKALGNSMAVPVMRWIGERVQMVEDGEL